MKSKEGSRSPNYHPFQKYPLRGLFHGLLWLPLIFRRTPGKKKVWSGPSTSIHSHPLLPPPFFPPLVTLVHCFHSKTSLNNSLLSSFLYSYRLVRDVRCSLVSSDEDSPFPSLYIPFARSNISILPPISPLSPNTPPTTIIMPEHEEDLVASQTEGFKVGEKKTIEEYQNLGMCYLRSPAPLPGNPIPLPLPVIVASWHPTSPPPPCLLPQSRQTYIASIPDTPPLKLEIVSLA